MNDIGGKNINNIFSPFRNILGEELEHLDINDLEQLERQLDSSLKTIRSNKVCKNYLAFDFLYFLFFLFLLL
jgi:hypothetical protein